MSHQKNQTHPPKPLLQLKVTMYHAWAGGPALDAPSKLLVI